MNKNNDHEIEQLIVHELNKLKKAVDSIEEAKETAIKSTSLLMEMESKYDQLQKRNDELSEMVKTSTEQLDNSIQNNSKITERIDSLGILHNEMNIQIDNLKKKYRTIQFVVYLGFGIATASIIIYLLA